MRAMRTERSGRPSSRAAAALSLAAAGLMAGCSKPPPAPPLERRTEYVQEMLVGKASVAAGAVQLRRGQADWDEVIAGEEIRSGDALRTTGPAAARIDFESGGGLRLAEPAQVTLSLSNTVPALPIIALESGLVRGFLSAPAPGGRAPAVQLTAPPSGRATLTAKGDKPVQLRLQRIQDGYEVALLAGQAGLAAAGVERALSVGEVAKVVSGDIREVEPLIDAPAPVSPEPDERFYCPGLVARLSWKEVGGASGYALQVAAEPTFLQPLLDAQPSATHAVFLPRAPGRFLWRVAAKDAQGRLGNFGEPRPLFCEPEPPADLLAAPEPSAEFRYHDAPPRLTFKWNPNPKAHSYVLVVARGGDLRAPNAIVKETVETSVDLDGLEDGAYVWGVYTGDSQRWPLFMSPRPFALARATVKTTETIKNWGN